MYETNFLSRSADASTVAIDVLSRQQDLVQQHFQQLAQLQKQHLSYGSSAGGSADASTLSSPNLLANQWLYLQLFGYSHMLRSIQAQEILKQVNNLSHSPVESGSNSGQVTFHFFLCLTLAFGSFFGLSKIGVKSRRNEPIYNSVTYKSQLL